MESGIETENSPGAVRHSWQQDYMICANCGNLIQCWPRGTSRTPEDHLKTNINGTGALPALYQTRSPPDKPCHIGQHGSFNYVAPSGDPRAAEVSSRWCVYAPKQDWFKEVQDWCPQCGCVVLSSNISFLGKSKTGCKPSANDANTHYSSVQSPGHLDDSYLPRHVDYDKSRESEFSPVYNKYIFRSNEALLQQAAETPEYQNLPHRGAAVYENVPVSISDKPHIFSDSPTSLTTATVSPRPWSPSVRTQDWSRQHSVDGGFEAESSEVLQTDSTATLGTPDAGPKRSSFLTFFSLVAMTLGALILAGILLFLLIDPTVNKPYGSMALQGKIPAVISKVNLRILNMDFRDGMDQRDSAEFYRVVAPFTEQINLAFLGSSLRKVYYGATVTSLGKGSIVTDFNQVFEDNGNIKSPDVINDVIYTSSKSVDWRGVKALKLGDFVICSDCINTTLQYQTLDSLPEKPVSSQPEMTTPPSTSQESNTSAPTSPTTQEWASTTSLPVTTRRSTDNFSSFTMPSFAFVTSTSSSTSSSATSSSTLAPTKPTSPAFPLTPATPEMATTSTSAPGEGKPVVTMPDVIAYRDDVNTSLSCNVSKAPGWVMVIIVHKMSPLPMLSLRADGFLDLPRSDLAPDLLTSYNVTEDSAYVTVTFRQLKCGTEGSYACEVITDDPARSAKATAMLTVKDLPGQPELTLPPTMVEGQNLSQPIQCRAELGFPEAFLSLTVLTPGVAEPRALPSTTAFSDAPCSVSAVAYASLRSPTPDLNGSIVICSLDHTHTRPGNFSATATMTVLKADVCNGASAYRLLPHPHSCSHFVNCTPSGPQVQACPDLVCFDPVSFTCGKASLVVESNVRPKDDGLTSVGCLLLNFPVWRTLTLRRVLDDGFTYDVMEADVSGNVTWKDPDLEARALPEFQSELHQQQLRLWIYVWKCSDHGTFECVASSITNTSTLSARGRLQIQAAPSPPILDVPLSVVEGQRAAISCRSDVGLPAGSPSLTLTFPNGTEVQPAFDDVIHDTIANCLSRVTGHYSVKESDVINGTLVTCHVNSSVREPPPDQDQLFVIPADICKSVLGRTPHPFLCGVYVDCTQPASPRVLACPSPTGQCLDLTVTPCPTSPPLQDLGPGSACPPIGQVALPHPTRCHVFLLCQDGSALEQSCREGQLYRGNGTCTADVRQSLCLSQPGR